MGEGERLERAEMRRRLRERLPEYMVPVEYVEIERVPLTVNGKVDRRALPEAEEGRQGGSEQAGVELNPIEDLVAGIWKQLLRVEEAGRGDNFFDLGGHSLLATQVASRVREVFGVELSLMRIFERPTLKEQADEIEEARAEGRHRQAPAIERVRREAGEGLPLSYAQQRLWFIDQLEMGGSQYNVPVAVRLTGELNESAW